MPLITSLGNKGILWIAACLIMLATKKYRRCGFVLAIALLAGALIGNVILKPLIARARPFEINPAIELLIRAPRDFSFPSGHTLAGFAAATALWPHRRSLGVTALIIACLIAFSRMYLYVHFPTDILGGIICGVLAGLFANWLYQRLDKIQVVNLRK